MSRQVVLIALALFAVLAIIVALVSRPRDGGHGVERAVTDTERDADPAEPGLAPVTSAVLYFPGTGSWLMAERREVPAGGDVVRRISAVVEALLAGPVSDGMRAPLPAGVELRKVYLVDGGSAYLNLESPGGEPPPASGSTREMLTVYSLVNTVLLNFDEVDSLVLLWNGHQLETFAGHVDTTRPLLARGDLIARVP